MLFHPRIAFIMAMTGVNLFGMYVSFILVYYVLVKKTHINDLKTLPSYPHPLPL